MSPQVSGVLASCFGLMNIFARSWGGIISDAMNAKFGMRGRIWAMWVVQVVEGFMCIVMGLVTINMASPDSGLGKTEAMFTLEGVDYKPFDADSMPYTIKVCGSLDIFDSSEISAAYDPVTNITYPAAELDLPKRFMIGDIEHMDCIRNKNIVGLTVFIMIIFSICVQARHAAAPFYPPSTPAPPRPAPPCPIGTGVASAPLLPEAPCQAALATAHRWPRGCTSASSRTSRGRPSVLSPAWLARVATVWLSPRAAALPPLWPAHAAHRACRSAHACVICAVRLGRTCGANAPCWRAGGAVLTLWTIFKNAAVVRTDEGFIVLGCVIIVTSLSMFGIYFPELGGMLFKPGGLGSYDPQRIKPPADFRGADQMDYSKQTSTQEAKISEA